MGHIYGGKEKTVGHIYERDPRRPGGSRSLCGCRWLGPNAPLTAALRAQEEPCPSCRRELLRREEARAPRGGSGRGLMPGRVWQQIARLLEREAEGEGILEQETVTLADWILEHTAVYPDEERRRWVAEELERWAIRQRRS